MGTRASDSVEVGGDIEAGDRYGGGLLRMKIGRYLEQSEGKESSEEGKPSEGEESSRGKGTSAEWSGEKVIIMHKNCPDGCAFGVLMKVAFGLDHRLRLIFAKHETVEKVLFDALAKVGDKGHLILGDICCGEVSFRKRLLPVMRRKALRVEVYEHHRSMEWLLGVIAGEGKEGKEGLLRIYYDEGRSASKILYDVLVKAKPWLSRYDDFIEVTNERDLWLNNDVRASMLAMLHQAYGDRLYMERFVKAASLDLTVEEEVLLGYLKRQESRRRAALIGRMVVKTDERGFRYGLIYGEGNGSDVLNEALHRFDLSYALLVNLHARKVSVRGRGEFDCEAYALRHRGGGHQQASGFLLRGFKPPVF